MKNLDEEQKSGKYNYINDQENFEKENLMWD